MLQTLKSYNKKSIIYSTAMDFKANILINIKECIEMGMISVKSDFQMTRMLTIILLEPKVNSLCHEYKKLFYSKMSIVY